MTNENVESAIIDTLLYHAVFGYPLTLTELHRYLISKHKVSKKELAGTIEDMQEICRIDERYGINGVTYTHGKRNERTAWRNLQKATRVMRKAGGILHVRVIAVSGSTAALSCQPDDDIDLFIIAKPKRMNITRALILTTLRLLGDHVNTRRAPHNNRGKFCANLFMSADNLAIPTDKRDIYTAMEIAHLKLILNNGQTFQRFLLSNEWIKELLANFWELGRNEWGLNQKRLSENNASRKPSVIGNAADKFTAHMQEALPKLRRVITREEPFVPTDHRAWILKEFEELKRRYKKEAKSADNRA